MPRKSVRIGIVAGAALDHFAALLRIKRLEKVLTVAELADRLGVSIPTARKLLRGNPAVATGTYFEAATILGLALFEPDQDRFQTSRDRVGKIESLLPKRVVKPAEDFDDDF
jgi:transcriptional regulator with XRE-family HTH domain